MSRLAAIVRRLYGDDLRSVASKVASGANQGTGRVRKKLNSLKEALGKQRTVVWGLRVIVILITLFVLAESVFQYNRLAASSTTVWARKADVDREYKRRANLIPNVFEMVRRYATYEKGVFKYVSDARAELKSIQDQSMTTGQMDSILKKAMFELFALAEQYPDLKATQSFEALITAVSTTEDRIALAKQEYNAASERYNQYQTTFPGNVFAFIYRFKPAVYIGLEEKLMVPEFDLSREKTKSLGQNGLGEKVSNTTE